MADKLEIETRGPALLEITDRIAEIVRKAAMQDGVAHLFLQHTSASLIIQENADPDVCVDLIEWFAAAAPEATRYRHGAEGPDDMPAHIKATLTNVSLTVPFVDNQLLLGTWQGIYLFEHRRGEHRRRIVVTLASAL